MIRTAIGRAVWRANSMITLARLNSLTREVVRERLTYLSPQKLARLEASASAVVEDQVQGDMLEFGVALGGSAIILADSAKQAGRRFHGFDVFGMIPPPSSDKDEADAKSRYETIASGASAGIGGDGYYGYRDDLHGDVCRAMAAHGVPVDGRSVTLHKGLFEETVPVAPVQQVALAHVDCDWYDPVKFCLQFLGAKLSPGGMIIIDDYHDFSGCHAATDEFMERHPDFTMDDGANVILRRHAGSWN
ncbi:TylF/MycF/NovP-related O-methyltransferase [Taklimakanibacter lacteus]|uniref:TylF/MycF/NovP-related O-methyltransferase n=1 Tax=Taklimakanibacter lacteus TaxID=2268456 RepID=UPI0034D5A10C